MEMMTDDHVLHLQSGMPLQLGILRFLTHGVCEASFVSLRCLTQLLWRAKLLCALRGYPAEPGSLKPGCRSTQFHFQMTSDQLPRKMRPEVEHHIVY